MEVTRHNFKQCLPFIEGIIEKSTFIAIDGEYSGLQSSKMQSYFYLDDTQQRYEKLRDSAETFSLLQFGMTCFSWNSSSKAFTPFAFSFFIFSDPSKLMRLEKRFSFQASSVAFLAENKFNFNKVFYDGIPFLSGAEEKVFRDKKGLAGNCSTHAAEENPLTLTSENQKFVDEKMEIIAQWFQNSPTHDMVLSGLNGFQRLIIYQQARLRFKGALCLSKTFIPNEQGKNGIGILVQRGSQEEKDAANAEEVLNSLHQEIGFRKIIDKLICRKVPLIVHNGILDLCHLYAKFVDHLPQSVIEFKKNFQKLFPIVYDTKFLANQPQLDSIVNNSHLCDLFESISKTTCTQIISSNIQFEFPSVHELHDSFSLKFPNYLENGGVFHDAGYDSFCTGYVFTYMMHFLAQQEGKIPDQVESEASEKPLDLAGLASIETDNHFKWIQDITISEYKNKMNMMRSDIGYLSMDGQDHIPDRSKLFYLTGRSWQASDMEKTFGSIGSPYRYYLVEENNAVFLDFAFGPVENSKSSKELANSLLNISNGSFTVESYSEYAVKSNNVRSQVIHQ